MSASGSPPGFPTTHTPRRRWTSCRNRRGTPETTTGSARPKTRSGGRSTLAAELGESRVPSSFELPPDPAAAAWVLSAAAPIGSFDRQQLLEAPTPSVRLDLLLGQVRDVSSVLAFRLYGR